jgi:hypothetical protein
LFLPSADAARLQLIRHLDQLTDQTAAGLPPLESLLAASQRATGAKYVLLALPISPWQVSSAPGSPTVDSLAAAVVERWAGQAVPYAVTDTWADLRWYAHRDASDEAGVRSLVLVPLYRMTPTPPHLVTFAFERPRADIARLAIVAETLAGLLDRAIDDRHGLTAEGCLPPAAALASLPTM